MVQSQWHARAGQMCRLDQRADALFRVMPADGDKQACIGRILPACGQHPARTALEASLRPKAERSIPNGTTFKFCTPWRESRSASHCPLVTTASKGADRRCR